MGHLCEKDLIAERMDKRRLEEADRGLHRELLDVQLLL